MRGGTRPSSPGRWRPSAQSPPSRCSPHPIALLRTDAATPSPSSYWPEAARGPRTRATSPGPAAHQVDFAAILPGLHSPQAVEAALRSHPLSSRSSAHSSRKSAHPAAQPFAYVRQSEYEQQMRTPRSRIVPWDPYTDEQALLPPGARSDFYSSAASATGCCTRGFFTGAFTGALIASIAIWQSTTVTVVYASPCESPPSPPPPPPPRPHLPCTFEGPQHDSAFAPLLFQWDEDTPPSPPSPPPPPSPPSPAHGRHLCRLTLHERRPSAAPVCSVCVPILFGG